MESGALNVNSGRRGYSGTFKQTYWGQDSGPLQRSCPYLTSAWLVNHISVL